MHAGNLLVLPDGRVGFIDFGIVSRIRRAAFIGCFCMFPLRAAAGRYRTRKDMQRGTECVPAAPSAPSHPRSPVTWRAVEALLLATGSGDYETMARALVTIGAASGEVDIKVGWRWCWVWLECYFCARLV